MYAYTIVIDYVHNHFCRYMYMDRVYNVHTNMYIRISAVYMFLYRSNVFPDVCALLLHMYLFVKPTPNYISNAIIIPT